MSNDPCCISKAATMYVLEHAIDIAKKKNKF